MRPLELTLKGFRSYREQTTFDWRGRRLVGVVGPIGAGKSSILDAIAFALFGKTPTYERDTKSLIHQRADECHVQLWFEVDGEVWRAARGLRRRGQSGHQLWHHTGDDPDSDVLEHVAGEKAVRERVEHLLGMEFGAFCRSVLLAQNRFSDFLKATPRERNEVLKGVFGYERFDSALQEARLRVAAAGTLVESLVQEGSELTAAREELEAATAAASEALERTALLERLKQQISLIVEQERGALERLGEAERRLAALEEAARSLPDAGTLGRDAAAAIEAKDAIDRAEDAVAGAEAARQEAEALHAAVAERTGDHTAFTVMVKELDHLAKTARSAAERHDSIASTHAQALEDAARADARAVEASAAVEVAMRAVGETSEAVRAAETALHEVRHADMARTLRADIAIGQPCPVCDHPVSVVPKAGRAPAISGAERALSTAGRAQEKARSAHGAATAEAAATAERRDASASTVHQVAGDLVIAGDQLRDADAAVAALQSDLVARLGEGDPRLLLQEHEAELMEAERARTAANEQLEDARRRLEETRAAIEEVRHRITGHATTIATTWGLLGDLREVAASPVSIGEAFAAAGEAILERNEEAEAERASATRDAENARTARVAALAEAGLPPDTDPATALASASAARGAAEERVTILRTRIEAGGDLDARLAGAMRDRDLATRLASDLQPSRFLAFLLEGERTTLADLGSVHFSELTDGAYRFTEDDRFDVLDVNAGAAQRRSDSLSGGETFLASLALALALAEMVTRGGGRLDAFFLDEGFGSLDADHLDRAMDGIGRLVAGHERRLVVLVSHVEQMRESIEDLIVLDKADVTGDTIVVRGALPAV
jgi:exonuclease SbcC